jgi:inhibitor of KinA
MKTLNPFSFFQLHPNALLIQWKKDPSDQLLNEILTLKSELSTHLKEIKGITQGYQSLLILFEKPLKSISKKQNEILTIYNAISQFKEPIAKHWTLPVCYDPIFGYDLLSLSNQLEIEPTKLIELHSCSVYRVQFIGFLPGFLYLNGLPKVLNTQRKAIPSPKVQPGSVGIGGSQSGIYPIESPGGWHIIGNTPVNLFNPEAKFPCFAESGDKISFEPISQNEYAKIKKAYTKGTYTLKHD